MSMLYCVAAISLLCYEPNLPLLIHLHISNRRVKREVDAAGLCVGIPDGESFESKDSSFVHTHNRYYIRVIEHFNDADRRTFFAVREGTVPRL
jgi:hypothetical protein